MNVKIGRIRKIETAGSLKGEASVIIEDAIELKKIKIVEGSNGLFISMPSQPYEKDGKTEYAPYFNPINVEARNEIQQVIIDAYNEL